MKRSHGGFESSRRPCIVLSRSSLYIPTMPSQIKHKVVLYNPLAVFHTMPLGLLAVGSNLDPERYDVRILDARISEDRKSVV